MGAGVTIDTALTTAQIAYLNGESEVASPLTGSEVSVGGLQLGTLLESIRAQANALSGGSTAALGFIINSDAVAGTDDDPTLSFKGGDGGSEIILSKFTQDSSLDRFYYTLGGGAAGATRKTPKFHLGFPGETTSSLDAEIYLNAAMDAGTTKQASIILLGQEQRLTITAPADIRLSDATATLAMAAGALTETALASVDLTPSGAMTLRGGGVSQFGDDVGYWAFDGSGALVATGTTAITLSPSGQLALQSGAAVAWGMAANSGSAQNFTIDAVNSGGGTGNLILTADDAIQIGDAGNPAINLAGSGAFTATGNPTFNLGTSLTTLGSLRVGADVDFARQAADVGEYGSGDSIFIVGAASLGRRNASADANPTVAFTQNGVEWGAGAGSVTDVLLARIAANTLGLAAGDSLNITNTGELVNDRYAKAVVAIVGGSGGATAGTLDIDIQTLAGVNVTGARVGCIVVNAAADRYAGSFATPVATVTFTTATLGSILATGAGYCIFKTDATGNFACTIDDTADETVYGAVISAPAGVTAAGEGCIIVESNSDDGVWAA